MAQENLTDIPAQEQEWPGSEAKLDPAPDHGASWTGRDRLTGKRVLITGGDSGIGRAVALTFAREGAAVAIAHLPQESDDAAETRRLVEETGGTCHLFPGDLRAYDANRDLARQAVEALGGLDVLVPNAAYQMTHDELEEFPPEQVERTFATNVFSPFWLARELAGELSGGGSVIITTSVQAYSPADHLLDYAASKAALTNLAVNLAAELATPPLEPVADKTLAALFGKGVGRALTALFLDAGHQVYGVEPNARMREVAERRFHAQPQFVSVAGAAEATSLPDHVAHLITVGQALHWFDLDQARQEFARVLAPDGWVALAWNLPGEDDSAMGRGFTQVWQSHVQSRAVGRGPRRDLVGGLFEGRPTIEARLRHAQRLEIRGAGRLEVDQSAGDLGDAGAQEDGRKQQDAHQVDGQHRRLVVEAGGDDTHQGPGEGEDDQRERHHDDAGPGQHGRGEAPGAILVALRQVLAEDGNERRAERAGDDDEKEQVRDAERADVGVHRARGAELVGENHLAHEPEDAGEDEGEPDDDRAAREPGADDRHVPRGRRLRILPVRGAGAALLPRAIVAEAAADGRLQIWSTVPHRTSEVWVLHASRRLVSTKITAFVEFMVESFRGKSLLGADRGTRHAGDASTS